MDSKYIADYHYVTGLAEGERQYDDSDLSGKVKIVDAKYVKSPIASNVGNPYIEALPMPRNNREIMEACERGIPGFSQEKEIGKSQYLQLLDVNELRHIRFTLPMNLELEQECYRALCLSYAQRSLAYDKMINVKYTGGNDEKITHGYLTANEAHCEELFKIHQNSIACANSTAQKAVLSTPLPRFSVLSTLLSF